MPNVTISELPDAILPLDGPNSFFEVQTIEGGVDVSRKVTADNITVSVTLPLGTAGQMIYNDGTTGTAYLATSAFFYDSGSDVPSLANAADSISLRLENLGGIPGAILRRTTGVAPNDLTLRFTEGSFIEVALAEVGYVASDNFRINNLGAAVEQWHANALVTRTQSFGLDIIHGSADTPILSFYDNTPTLLGFVGYQVAGTRLAIINQVTSGDIQISAFNSGAAQRLGITIDPDGDVELYHPSSNASVTRTVSAASGGLEANNLSTGAGFERVLTTSDAGALPDPLTIGRIIITNSNVLDLVDTTVALNVGAADPDTGPHIEFGPFSTGLGIQAKATDTTVDTLFIQPLGETVTLGPPASATLAGGVNLRHANGAGSGGNIIETTISGIILEGRTGANTILDFHAVNANLAMRMVYNGANFQFDGFINSEEIQFQSRNSGAAVRQLLHLDPDTGAQIYHASNDRIAIETQALGVDFDGTQFNFIEDTDTTVNALWYNTTIGGGMVQALSGSGVVQFRQVSNAGAAEDIWWAAVRNGGFFTYHNNIQQTETQATGLLVTSQLVDLSDGTNETKRFRVWNTTGGGIALTSAATTGQGSLSILSTAGAATGNFMTFDQGGALTGFHNGSSVFRTETAANGGLEANNTLTGAGFERVLTESDVGGTVLTAMKTSSETINNDATVNDDTDLQLAMVANQRYSFEMFFDITTGTTADFQFEVRGPTGFNMDALAVIGISDDIVQVTQVSNTVIDSTSAALVYHVTITGKIFCTANGNVRFRWAQDVSDAANTTLLIGSWMRIQRLT